MFVNQNQPFTTESIEGTNTAAQKGVHSGLESDKTLHTTEIIDAENLAKSESALTLNALIGAIPQTAAVDVKPPSTSMPTSSLAGNCESEDTPQPVQPEVAGRNVDDNVLYPLTLLAEECDVGIRTLRSWIEKGLLPTTTWKTKKGQTEPWATIRDVRAVKSSKRRGRCNGDGDSKSRDSRSGESVLAHAKHHTGDLPPWDEGSKRLEDTSRVQPSAEGRSQKMTSEGTSPQEHSVDHADAPSDRKRNRIAVKRAKNSMRHFARDELFAILVWICHRLFAMEGR